jgi:hypothetical protein
MKPHGSDARLRTIRSRFLPTSNMGYRNNFATSIDVNCSYIGQVAITRQTRRMLFELLLNCIDKSEQRPSKSREILLQKNQLQLIFILFLCALPNCPSTIL